MRWTACYEKGKVIKMETFSEMVTEVVNTLKSNTKLRDICFTQEFPTAQKPNPMKKIYAAVGMESVAVEHGAVGGYFGIQGEKELYGRRAELVMRIAVYAPQSLGGAACTQAFSRICDALIFDSALGVYAVNAGKVSYDGTAFCFVTDCSAKLRVYLGRAEDSTAVSDIVVKGAVK